MQTVKLFTRMENGSSRPFSLSERAAPGDFSFAMEYLFFWSLASAARIKEKASKDMKKGGEIIADGVTVYKNGKWVA